jgi:hypothetical protein
MLRRRNAPKRAFLRVISPFLLREWRMDLWETAEKEKCAKKGIFESNLSLSVKGVEDGSLGVCWEGVMRQKGHF